MTINFKNIDINQIKKYIIEILEQYGQLTRNKLLFLLRQKGIEITDRQLRKIKEKMYEIGSCHTRGYFLIKTEQDILDNEKEYWSKIKTMINNIKQRRTKFESLKNNDLFSTIENSINKLTE